MARFKLIRGRHIEGTKTRKSGDSRKYFKVGDVIESDRDLDEIYPNKFERLGQPSTQAGKAQKAMARAIKKGNPGDGEPANISVSADEPLPHGTTKGASTGNTRIMGAAEDDEDADPNAENFVAGEEEDDEDVVPAEDTGDEDGDEEPEEPVPAAAPKKGKAGKTAKAAKAGKTAKAAKAGKKASAKKK